MNTNRDPFGLPALQRYVIAKNHLNEYMSNEGVKPQGSLETSDGPVFLKRTILYVADCLAAQMRKECGHGIMSITGMRWDLAPETGALSVVIPEFDIGDDYKRSLEREDFVSIQRAFFAWSKYFQDGVSWLDYVVSIIPQDAENILIRSWPPLFVQHNDILLPERASRAQGSFDAAVAEDLIERRYAAGMGHRFGRPAP